MGLAVVGAGAGTSSVASADPTKQLRADAAGAEVELDYGRGTARFIRTPAGVAGLSLGDPAEVVARAFADRYAALLGVASAADLRTEDVVVDALGHTHVRFAQQFAGLPVYGADVRMHFDAAGSLIRAQASTVPNPSISTTPAIGDPEAVTVALDHAGALVADPPQLFVFDLGLIDKLAMRPRLAYAVDVRGPGVDATVMVDAIDGTVVFEASHLHDVLDRAAYEFGYGPGFLVWQESDGPYAGADAQMAALIDYTEDTYELFFNVSGGTYESYDGESATMETVLYAPLQCPNAQWNGTTTNYCDGLATDDVVGHEWVHGYTQLNHGLIYAHQPGALNESYSDIFGEAIDLLNGAGLDTPGDLRAVDTCTSNALSVRWLVGEDTQGLGGAIRDMWDPTCMAHPGRVGDFEYFCNFDGEFFDNGGVHINSGVPNHAFALLVDGGTYNGTMVPAIGMTKALAIYWRAMTVYQGQVSGFAEHADALVASCEDLLGTDAFDPVTGMATETIEQADCDAVQSATVATEMTAANPCGEGPLFDPGDPPPACGDDDGIEVFVEDFEDGLAGWSVSNEGVAPEYEPRDWEVLDTLPDGVEGMAAFANGDISLGDCQQQISQAGVMHLDAPEIVLPKEGDPVLSFSHWLASEPLLDGGNLEISVSGGPFVDVPASAFIFNGYNAELSFSENPLSGEDAFTGSDATVPTGSWVTSVVDLSGLASGGDTVIVRFDFGVNLCNGLFGWYVDDVRLAQCAADDGTTGDTTGDSTDSTDSTDSGPPADTTVDDGGTGPDVTDGTTGAPLPPTDDDGTSSETGEDPGADTESGGCGCTTGSRTTFPWLLFLLFPLVRSRHEPIRASR